MAATASRVVADIIIPVGPYHADVAVEAATSALAQSVAVNTIVVEDTQGRGAGWARNEGARRGRAPFLVFLDADDLLHPEFVERTARHYEPGRFVYTDWQADDGTLISLPDNTDARGWHAHRFHLVTTLLPRALFEHVGGFDVDLPAAEDTDLYRKLRRLGVCGVRCADTLVTYRASQGQRARSARGQVDELMRLIDRRYGRSDTMGCCGGKQTVAAKPAGQPGEDMVLVRTLWRGNQKMSGRVTGQVYPYSGNGKLLWVHTADARAMTDLFEPVINPADLSPDLDTVLALVEEAKRELE